MQVEFKLLLLGYPIDIFWNKLKLHIDIFILHLFQNVILA